MPQLQLPFFPAGLTPITNDIGFHRQDGKVVYFHGHLPVFSHAVDDLKSFRLFSSQLLDQGTVRQADVVRAFDVPLVTVKRYLKLYRHQGAAGFFRPPRRRGAGVLTPEVSSRAQALLDEGAGVPQVSRALGVAANTLHKAIRAGRLRALKKNP
jgi:hypothetical protein